MNERKRFFDYKRKLITSNMLVFKTYGEKLVFGDVVEVPLKRRDSFVNSITGQFIKRARKALSW